MAAVFRRCEQSTRHDLVEVVLPHTTPCSDEKFKATIKSCIIDMYISCDIDIDRVCGGRVELQRRDP